MFTSGIRGRLNPGKLKFQKETNQIQTVAGKSKFHDDVINYEGAQLRAVYLVTAESAQQLHPGEPRSKGNRP